jgi:transcriptional regulator with XRE-family HTH domain
MEGPLRLPPDQCQRIFAGEAPLKVWREFKGMEQTDLRRATAIRVEAIDRIERGLRKPTRAEAVKLARAMDIAAHNLEPHPQAYQGCSSLDLDEEEILSREDD